MEEIRIFSIKWPSAIKTLLIETVIDENRLTVE